MISKLLNLIISGLILLVIFWIIGWFVGGILLNVIGAIIAICFLVHALSVFGFIV